MRSILGRRGGRPIYIIDVAVPRDFEATIGRLDGVFLHAIDDLNVLVDRNIEKRRSEISQAETIVEQELEHFMSWRSSRSATPLIKKIHERLEELRAQEISRHKKRFCLEDRNQLELLTESLVKKILHPLMYHVREWSDESDLGSLRIDTLYKAFDLEQSDENDPHRKPR